jgi:hypothetical protein
MHPTEEGDPPGGGESTPFKGHEERSDESSSPRYMVYHQRACKQDVHGLFVFQTGNTWVTIDRDDK